MTECMKRGIAMSRQNLNGILYTFRTGDNLYSVSRRYNVTIAAISRENPLMDIYNLRAGDEILLPVNVQTRYRVLEYTVKNNETIQNILNRFNIEFEELLNYNDLETLKLDQGTLLHIPTKEYDTSEVS